MSSETFSLLCKLEWFDLRSNCIDQNTLVGFLSCNLTNIKDQKTIDASKIDASKKGLRGNAAHVCLSKRLNARILSWSCTGGIPPELLRMIGKGCHVDLRGNDLSFMLPSQIGDLSEITSLDLSLCPLRGALVRDINSELSHTISRRIGAIPDWIGNLTSLQKLSMWGNELQGLHSVLRCWLFLTRSPGNQASFLHRSQC